MVPRGVFTSLVFTIAVVLPYCRAEHWEYGAVYELSAGTDLAWVFNSNQGSYADEHLVMSFIPTDEGDSHGLEEALTHASEAEAGGHEVEVESKGYVAPSDHHVYHIEFEPETSSTMVYLNMTTAGYVAFFLSHAPAEFSASLINTTSGAVIHYTYESTSFEDDDHHESADAATWGETMAAVIVTCSFSLVGAVFLLIFNTTTLTHVLKYGNAFAGGVLLAAGFVHVLPEGISLLSVDEEAKGWQSGSVVLAAFVTGILIKFLLPHDHHQVTDSLQDASPAANSGSNTSAASSVELVVRAKQATDKLGASDEGAVSAPGADSVAPAPFEQAAAPARISSKAWAIIWGDAFHNFFDGALIASAFKSCASMGWVVTGAAIAHELPQEVGDFFALMAGGMSLKQALGFNLLSSLSAFLGAIIVLSADITPEDLGFMLIYGGGMLIYIGASEILPEMSIEHCKRAKFLLLLAFAVGAVAVSLGLLGHAHCEEGHEGHGHGSGGHQEHSGH